MLNRGFFSLQSAWTPTLVALANLGLNAALDALFYRLGTWGIALATSLVNIAGTALLLILLRRRLGRIDFTATVASTSRILIAAAVLGAVSYGIWKGLDEALGRAIWAQLVAVGGAIGVGTVVYLVSCRLLGVRELNALLALRDRFPRR
jgi:putative peptidoglycan lipid II flippase